MPTSATEVTEGAAPEGGFTLVELLVVLALLGLLLGIFVGPLARPVGPEIRLAKAAGDIRDGLARTRTEAIVAARETLFVLDLAARRYTAGAGAAGSLDPTLDLTVEAAAVETYGKDLAVIRFFPDGRSTGGRIALAAEGRQRRITIDWLTGRARNDAP